MKTEILENVGMHAFEVAGLGKAPFRFVGADEKFITYPDGSTQAAGSCDYCGTGIRLQCYVQSADGKRFKVGCNCIEKVGDTGLLKAYKTSPTYRAKQSALRANRAAAVRVELLAKRDAMAPILSANPHPRGFTDRETGKPMTELDYVNWMIDHCGTAGSKALLKWLQAR